MKNKKIVELMLILGVTAGLAGGCTQKTKEQSYVNITKTAAENSTEQSQEYLYDENGNQYHYIKTEGYEVKEICNDIIPPGELDCEFNDSVRTFPGTHVRLVLLGGQ